jgi:hypothetical protein
MSSSTFVSLLGLIERCRNLGFLILDADLTSELGVGAGMEMEMEMEMDGWGDIPHSSGNRVGTGHMQNLQLRGVKKEEGMWEEDVWEVLNALEARKHVPVDDDENESLVDRRGQAGDTPRKRSRTRKTHRRVTVDPQFVTDASWSAVERSDEDGDAEMSDSAICSRPTTASSEGYMAEPPPGMAERRPIVRLPSRAGATAHEGSQSDGAQQNVNSVSDIPRGPSPLSLMLCGPIRGWKPSREALAWSERHLKGVYTRSALHADVPSSGETSRKAQQLRNLVRPRDGLAGIENRGIPLERTGFHSSATRGRAEPDYYRPRRESGVFFDSQDDQHTHVPLDMDFSSTASTSAGHRGQEVNASDINDDPRPRVFLDGVVERYNGIKELFIDRPVRVRRGYGIEVLKLLVSWPWL